MLIFHAFNLVLITGYPSKSLSFLVLISLFLTVDSCNIASLSRIKDRSIKMPRTESERQEEGNS